MKFTSREMRLKKFIAKKTLKKRNSKSHPRNYFSMQWMKQKYWERGEMRLAESRNLVVCFVLFVIWDLPHQSPYCNLGTIEKPLTSKGGAPRWFSNVSMGRCKSYWILNNFVKKNSTKLKFRYFKWI